MKFGSMRCVHCIEWFDPIEMTCDHVFPRSWYPLTTPANLQKWQIPACRGCNADYGKIEQRLLVRLGLCVDPTEFESLGISHKALRAIDPTLAKDGKDRRHRQAQREKILQSLRPAQEARLQPLPGFGLRSGISDQFATTVAKDDLDALATKLVRGIAYVTTGNYIEADHRIEVFFLQSAAAQPIADVIRELGTEEHRGPGISIARAVVPEDSQSGLFHIEIWGRVRMDVVVKPVKWRLSSREGSA